MKRTNINISNWKSISLAMAFLGMLLMGFSSDGFAADAANGEKLFKANCASCHFPDRDMTGPALKGVEERAPSKEWIYDWVKNSTKVIASGDQYAVDLYAKWNNTQMTAFPSFTNENIDDILLFVEEYKGAEPATTQDIPSVTDDPKIMGVWGWIKLILFVVVLLMISIAIQITRLRGVEFFPDLDLNKFNGRMMLTFLVLGLMGVAWSVIAYRDHYLLNNSASEHGASIDFMFWMTMVVVFFVFIVTNFLLFIFAWKYHGKEGQKAYFYPENHKLELIWTVVPAIVLTILVIFGVRTWNDVMIDVKADDAYVIELNAQQFAWNIHYPGKDQQLGDVNVRYITPDNILGVNFAEPLAQDDFMANELHLPKGKPVILKIRSRDVLHSVYLPHFRVKMDAVPGMPTRFVFTPTLTTQEMRKIRDEPEFEYELACTEVCGKGHFSMRRVVVVEEEADYLKWVAEQAAIYDPQVHAAQFTPANKVAVESISEAKVIEE